MAQHLHSFTSVLDWKLSGLHDAVQRGNALKCFRPSNG